MSLFSMEILLYLSLMINTYPVIGDVCLQQSNRWLNEIDVEKEFHVQSFADEDIGYYRSMAIAEASEELIVGGKNSILYFNANSLNLTNHYQWNPKDSFDTCISNIHVEKRICGNYIQHVSIFKNKLFVCGTNSMQPTYRVITLDSHHTITSEKDAFGICAAPDPDYQVTAKITDLGEIIAGTYSSRLKAILRGDYVANIPRVPRVPLKTQPQMISNPTFITSVYAGDAVYMFFMEEAAEKSGEKLATVGRLCQTDSGSPEFSFSTETWTTFRKTRLVCEHENQSKHSFKNLVDVTFDMNTKVFYAAFTMTRNDNIASAICSFTLKDLETNFNGEFLDKNWKMNRWYAVPNGGFLNGCKVNPSNTTGKNINVPNGKEPTNTLDLPSWRMAVNLYLMARPLVSNSKLFQFMSALRTFRRLAVDSIKIPNKKATSVINIVSDNSILSVYKPPGLSDACVIEELKLEIKDVNQILVNGKKRFIYVSSDEKIIKMDADNCRRYSKLSECIEAHDPRCGWSTQKNQCISWSKVKNGEEWLQELSKCPVMKSLVGNWSPWKTCTDSSSRACLCRERNCLSCNTSVCKDIEKFQIQNCTANPVTNLKSWFEIGAKDGYWSPWQQWSSTYASACGNHSLTRQRKCLEVSNGGKYCNGDNYQCMLETCVAVWKEWSIWSDCLKQGDIYQQKRSRTCSHKEKCQGDSIETRVCSVTHPSWSSWSNCDCKFKIKHRYPYHIPQCNACDKLRIPDYAKCIPKNCDKVQPTIDSNHVEKPQPVPTWEKYKKNDKGIQLSLRDVILATCGIAVTCFLICTLVVVLILKQKRRSEIITSDIEIDFSPHLIRNASAEDILDQDTYTRSKQNGIKLNKLSPRGPTEIPLINNMSNI